ncbi:MAG: hypothetical protein JNK11_01500 [Alphaproteobacteria bacterium]|nr:hypothetical protein [Alphaproteobacteria bacterium]
MRVALALLLVSALAGCGAAAGPVIAGATVATYVNTGKSPVDHLAEEATDEECNIVNLIEGKKYCKPRVDKRMQALKEAEAQPYCYKTLGRITCYDTPDPYANNQIPMR